MMDGEWDLLDRKALGMIRLCLEISMAFNISKEMKTVGLMTTLVKLYEKTSASNNAFIMNRIFNMKMSEHGSVVDHLNEFNTVKSQLSSIWVNFDDDEEEFSLKGGIFPSKIPQKVDLVPNTKNLH